jgi:hypothetical protein
VLRKLRVRRGHASAERLQEQIENLRRLADEGAELTPDERRLVARADAEERTGPALVAENEAWLERPAPAPAGEREAHDVVPARRAGGAAG